jgi:hypothetical protein
MTARKGDKIRFIAGKYGGKTGWLNISEPADDKVTPVIVDQGRKGEKITYVYTSSFKLQSTTVPTSYAEAVIQQCTDVEKDLVAVCRKLAKCDLRRDLPGFKAVLSSKLQEATEWQESKGSKAMFRKIQF